MTCCVESMAAFLDSRESMKASHISVICSTEAPFFPSKSKNVLSLMRRLAKASLVVPSSFFRWRHQCWCLLPDIFLRQNIRRRHIKQSLTPRKLRDDYGKSDKSLCRILSYYHLFISLLFTLRSVILYSHRDCWRSESSVNRLREFWSCRYAG